MTRDIRGLVINGIFTRFHNLLYSFLPSARDLCSHHILAALTWFLWFHICSSADIQDVQFVLLNRLGPRGEVMLKNQYKIQRVSIRRSHGITMKVRRKKLCKGYLHVAGDGRIRNQESSHQHEKIREQENWKTGFCSQLRAWVTTLGLYIKFSALLLWCVCLHAQLLCHVLYFATPWTVACQAPFSMGFLGKNTAVGCHFLLWGF